MSEELITSCQQEPSTIKSRAPVTVLTAGILAGSYQDSPTYKRRVARHLRRKSGKRSDFFARSFSGEQFVLRAFTVFHRALAVERGAGGLGLTFRSLLFLLIAKYYLTHSGKDYFFAGQVGRFSNLLLWKQYSIRNAVVHCILLQRLNYINAVNPETKTNRTKYVLSMKSRALFRELDKHFKRATSMDLDIQLNHQTEHQTC
jgi:hypothetical protein